MSDSKIVGNIKDIVSNWYYNKEDMDSKLDDKSDTEHTHVYKDITDLSDGYYNKTEVDDKLTGKADADFTKTVSVNTLGCMSNIQKMGQVAFIHVPTLILHHGGTFTVHVYNCYGDKIDVGDLSFNYKVYGGKEVTGTNFKHTGTGIYSFPNFLKNTTSSTSISIEVVSLSSQSKISSVKDTYNFIGETFTVYLI